MTNSSATTPTTPKAETIVPYLSYSTPSGKPNGALHVFGDVSSPKMALLCPGFPDDQTVFLPLAKALSKDGILVGVMCLPGYDDRPEDGVPWESHPRKGFSYQETAKAVREASKALQGVSTCRETPEFIGIFFDWGVMAGTIWAYRLEQEAKDGAQVLRPNKIVFLDVLLGTSSKMPDSIPRSAVPQQLTLHQRLCRIYMILLATSSAIQLHLSRRLAVAFTTISFYILYFTGIFPLEMSDIKSRNAIYGDRMPGSLRCMSMTYMYRNIFSNIFASKTGFRFGLHQDWKTTPVLYLYGKLKNTQYHSNRSFAMLKREEAEKRSLSRAVGLEGAGHYLFLQKQEECLKHILDFIRAENTFTPKVA